jgi:hypothetical protein
MSAMGQKQTSGHVRAMSALPPKADITAAVLLVRRVPGPLDARFVMPADPLNKGRSRRFDTKRSTPLRPPTPGGKIAKVSCLIELTLVSLIKSASGYACENDSLGNGREVDR